MICNISHTGTNEFTWLNETQWNMLSGFKNKLETFQLLVDLKKKKMIVAK